MANESLLWGEYPLSETVAVKALSALTGPFRSVGLYGLYRLSGGRVHSIGEYDLEGYFGHKSKKTPEVEIDETSQILSDIDLRLGGTDAPPEHFIGEELYEKWKCTREKISEKLHTEDPSLTLTDYVLTFKGKHGALRHVLFAKDKTSVIPITITDDEHIDEAIQRQIEKKKHHSALPVIPESQKNIPFAENITLEQAIVEAVGDMEIDRKEVALRRLSPVANAYQTPRHRVWEREGELFTELRHRGAWSIGEHQEALRQVLARGSWVDDEGAVHIDKDLADLCVDARVLSDPSMLRVEARDELDQLVRERIYHFTVLQRLKEHPETVDAFIQSGLYSKYALEFKDKHLATYGLTEREVAEMMIAGYFLYRFEASPTVEASPSLSLMAPAEHFVEDIGVFVASHPLKDIPLPKTDKTCDSQARALASLLSHGDNEGNPYRKPKRLSEEVKQTLVAKGTKRTEDIKHQIRRNKFHRNVLEKLSPDLVGRLHSDYAIQSAEYQEMILQKLDEVRRAIAHEKNAEYRSGMQTVIDAFTRGIRINDKDHAILQDPNNRIGYHLGRILGSLTHVDMKKFPQEFIGIQALAFEYFQLLAKAQAEHPEIDTAQYLLREMKGKYEQGFIKAFDMIVQNISHYKSSEIEVWAHIQYLRAEFFVAAKQKYNPNKEIYDPASEQFLKLQKDIHASLSEQFSKLLKFGRTKDGSFTRVYEREKGLQLAVDKKFRKGLFSTFIANIGLARIPGERRFTVSSWLPYTDGYLPDGKPLPFLGEPQPGVTIESALAYIFNGATEEGKSAYDLQEARMYEMAPTILRFLQTDASIPDNVRVFMRSITSNELIERVLSTFGSAPDQDPNIVNRFFPGGLADFQLASTYRYIFDFVRGVETNMILETEKKKSKVLKRRFGGAWQNLDFSGLDPAKAIRATLKDASHRIDVLNHRPDVKKATLKDWQEYFEVVFGWDTEDMKYLRWQSYWNINHTLGGAWDCICFSRKGIFNPKVFQQW